MPTYEYACKACGHSCDIFQSIMDKPLKKCPECGRRSFERKIGAGAGFIFKGSGFYETDYRSESYKSDARKDKEPSTPSTPSTPSKPSTGASESKESKPEDKSPSSNGASENKGKAAGGKMKAAS